MERKETRGLRFVLLVYAASRAFYLVAGIALARIAPVGDFQAATTDAPFGTMNLWAHFDGEHYARLASNGYLEPPNNMSPAFFPLHPLLMRSFAALFGGPTSLEVLALWGVVISLVALPFALYFIYQIAENLQGEQTAKIAVTTLAFFPTTFFLNAAYTESLFLALSAGAIWAAMVRKDLLLACVLAGVATATRNVGIFLLVPLGYEWLRHAGYYRWRVGYLVLAPSGLIAYMGYLWVRFGEPLLFYTEQEDWNRQATGPITTLERTWAGTVGGVRTVWNEAQTRELTGEQLMLYFNALNNAYNMLFLVFAFALFVGGLRVLPLGLSVYAFLIAIFPAFFGTPELPLMGLSRYVLVAFPLFIVLGVLLDRAWQLAAWLVFSISTSLIFCAMFVTWWYVA